MDNDEIKRRINSFPRWHYQLNLKGNLTPIFDRTIINRHQERKKYFFDPLVQFLGGSLTGKRVLDLGCNAGFWSLCAVESGCDFVLGIDGRQMHIDQANLVFQVNEIEVSKYQFIAANVFDCDLEPFGQFDVVLCLGLMYHTSKPMVLMEIIAQHSSDILVIDTFLSAASGSYLEICHEDLDEPRHAVDYRLVINPTRQAVVDMARQFGYSVAILKPQFQDYTGASDYETGRRRAFLCAKRADVTGVVAELEPLEAPGEPAEIPRSAKEKLTRFFRKRLFRQ